LICFCASIFGCTVGKEFRGWLTWGREEDEDKTSSAIFVQKLLRGRAAQNAMMEGKERRLELIKELRSVESLGDVEADAAAKAAEELERHKARLVAGHVGNAIGGEVSRLLEYLSRELVRFKEERRIAAMVMLAERERRLREAEESGLRGGGGYN
jgi:hypothetical protein